MPVKESVWSKDYGVERMRVYFSISKARQLSFVVSRQHIHALFASNAPFPVVFAVRSVIHSTHPPIQMPRTPKSFIISKQFLVTEST